MPALKDVLAGLKVDRARAQKIVTLLLRDKVLVKISEDLVFHRDALEDLRKRMASEKAKSAKIEVARFKDLAGVSRKYAIPLAGISRPRTRDPAGRRRESDSLSSGIGGRPESGRASAAGNLHDRSQSR